MNKREGIPVIIVSSVLVINYFISFFTSNPTLLLSLYLTSPFLLGWMVYSVIRYGIFKGDELEKDEEYGYADKKKEELGIF